MPSVRRLVALSIGALLAGALSLGPSLTVPASASSSSYLCTGYSGCAKAGYSSSGYASAGKKMYWRMYAGHNCTNYAAYRMIQSGMSTSRPWSGSGNASNWGAAMKKITNKTPSVGAIAWWPAHAPGAGSSGHVAYVERVVSSTEIIISEDMWGGDFHWRDIKTGDRWPKGFVHFNDAPLASTAAPVISGVPKVGVPLTASTGAWPGKGTSYSFQWLAGGTAITGATSSTYVPTSDQRGKALAVTVTASAAGYQSGNATSADTTRVAAGTLFTSSAPTISGKASLGESLTADIGTWSPTPTTRLVQWYADGTAIPGAVSPTLVLGREQVDTQVSVRVTARLAGYSKGRVTSAAVGPVLAGRITVDSPFRLRGSNRVGHTLSLVPGTYTPNTATLGYQWLRGAKPIPGATGPTYRVTAADLGSRLTTRVTISDPRYLDTVTVLRTSGRTTTRPTVTFGAVGKPHHAVVKVRVRGPGATRPRGGVTVKVGMRSVSGHLVHGRFTADVAGLSHGPRKVRVYYQGAGSVEKASARGAVRLPRR